MPSRIEDYALIGDTHSCGLVARDGSIDWMAFPRFDSPACFAALLGDEENGHWRLAPSGDIRRITRHYHEDTLILETLFETAEGSVALVDFMTPRHEQPVVVRIVEGRSGRVPMRMEMRMRFDYGSIVPWVRRQAGLVTAVGGPEALSLSTPVGLRGEDLSTVADFAISSGDQVPFVLGWHPSSEPAAELPNARAALAETENWWRTWRGGLTYGGEYAEEVAKSLIVLKALTYAPTGGIVAAATTSLPEHLGGARNWDYRYCWLRDATFSLIALLSAGYTSEASAWRDWLLRTVAGDPSKLQIMYGAAGERRLTELELDWLPGYESSAPVRIGNAASSQFQLDVYGEVMDALDQGRRAGLPADPDAWALQKHLIDFLEGSWKEPDEGIWEVRGPRQNFTHSKVMAWVALDRAVNGVVRFGLDGPVERWRELRAEIHADVLANGVDDRGVFVQHYDTTDLDASLLIVPLVGFLPPDDERVANTVEAIEGELMQEGFVLRYQPTGVDGLQGEEGTFLLCSFWMADNYAMIGRRDDAVALYERLLDLRNDVGLLSEEYEPKTDRLLGNFPQAFSHVSIVNTATNLCRNSTGASEYRGTSALADEG